MYWGHSSLCCLCYVHEIVVFGLLGLLYADEVYFL